MRPTLVLVRGIPGSGKSTYAKNTYPTYVHLSTDMYFTKDGEYKYDISKIREAHAWCLEETQRSLSAGQNVVVANTFITRRDMNGYMNLVDEVKIVRMSSYYKNTHKVPISKIETMLLALEPVNGEEVIKGRYINFHMIHKKTDQLSDSMKPMWLSLTEQHELGFQLKTQSEDKGTLKSNLKYLAHVLTAYAPPLRDELGDVEVLKQTQVHDPSRSALKITKNRVMLMLSDNGDPRMTIELSDKDLVPIKGVHDPKLVCDSIRASLRKHPRKYLFCDLQDVNKEMGFEAYAKFMKNLYYMINGKAWSILMARRSYVTHWGTRYLNDMSGEEINVISRLMRFDWQKHDTLFFYKVMNMTSR